MFRHAIEQHAAYHSLFEEPKPVSSIDAHGNGV